MSGKVTSIQLRRGTRLEWEQANPILMEGEAGFEIDTYRFKVGKRDNTSGELLRWRELRYAAPYSGDERPVYPQTGDFHVESNPVSGSTVTIDNPGENLYYYNGIEWIRVAGATNPHFDGEINISGPIDMTNGCFASDVLPCSDLKFDLGSPTKRWEELYVGSDEQGKIQFGSYEISVGESSWEDSNLNRLQVNGDDIALRSDFRRYDTRDLNLYRGVDDEGNPIQVPREYKEYVERAPRTLPPETNLYTQAGFNEWAYLALQQIVGYPDKQGAQLSEHWNNTVFKQPLAAEKGVVTPVQGNVTDYNNQSLGSKYFHKADGSVCNRVPLIQSYWDDVPRLLEPRSGS